MSRTKKAAKRFEHKSVYCCLELDSSATEVNGQDSVFTEMMLLKAFMIHQLTINTEHEAINKIQTAFVAELRASLKNLMILQMAVIEKQFSEI
jgi:hypothetical protein